MSRTYNVRLNKYNISPKRYKELCWFCQQYNEMKSKLESLYALQAVQNSDKIQNNEISDTTSRRAIQAERLSREIKLIEDAVLESARGDERLAEYILMNVCEGTTYTYIRYTLEAPYGRDKFYRTRRLFYYILDQRR